MVVLTQKINIGVTLTKARKLMNVSDRLLKGTVDATKKIVEGSITESKRIYEKKRKTSKMPSMILDSFTYKISTKGKTQAVGLIFAGGPSASHAKYLEYDRRLRNGKSWSSVNPDAPYAFMLAGIKVAKDISLNILKTEIKAALKTKV